MTSIKLTRRNEAIILFGLFLVASVIRMLTYNSIFIGNDVRFLEFDTFYHMRRVVSFAQHFPYIWNFDTYLDYPYGNAVGWPPLYDWTIAFGANILGLGDPNIHLIEVVGAYFPVLIGSLSIVVIYFVAKEIFTEYHDNDSKNKSWQIGLISGLLLAVLPAFVQVSFLGFVDHHVAEVLLSLTAYLFLLKTLKAKDIRNRLIFICVTGLIIVVAMFTWPGTPIFIGIILTYIIVQTIIDKRYKNLLIIIGVMLASYAGLYILFPDIYNNLRSGISFLTREGPVMQQIYEAQPLFFATNGKFTLEPSWYSFNTALYIAIISIILYVANIIKEPRNEIKNRSKNRTRYRSKNDTENIYKDDLLKNRIKNRTKIFFLVWTMIVLVMNLYQVRFIYLFAVNIAILCAYLITELVNSNKTYVKIIGTILLMSTLILSIQTVNEMAKSPLMLSNDWFTSLEWLKQNTPEPGNWDTPLKDQIPNYGIMTWWDYGNYVLYLSQRPVIANNFQLGIEDSAKFFASENESDANAIMSKRRAKYVIVDYRLGLNLIKTKDKIHVRGAWISLAPMSGKGLRYYLDKNNWPNERYFSTMYARLYLFDGEGLNNYRLIYKSQTQYPDVFNRPIEEIKIFEYTG